MLAWDALGELDTYRITQIPRRADPGPAQPPSAESDDAGRTQRLAALVAAYAVLQLKARSGRARAAQRRYDPWDWRTYPPETGPGGRDSGAPHGNEESSRPDWRYGYPPGYEPYPLYDQARSPWAVKDDAIRDRRS